MGKEKWYYKPQEQIKKKVQSIDQNYSFVDQQFNEENIFEKYLVKIDGNLRVILFHIRKDDFGEGYTILSYIDNQII